MFESTRPTPLTITVMTRKAAEALRVGYGAPSGVRGKWVAVVAVAILDPGEARKAVLTVAGAGYDSGMPGSMHDARFDDALAYAFGRSPARTRRRLVKALTALATVPLMGDSASLRAGFRNMVREGD